MLIPPQLIYQVGTLPAAKQNAAHGSKAMGGA